MGEPPISEMVFNLDIGPSAPRPKSSAASSRLGARFEPASWRAKTSEFGVPMIEAVFADPMAQAQVRHRADRLLFPPIAKGPSIVGPVVLHVRLLRTKRRSLNRRNEQVADQS